MTQQSTAEWESRVHPSSCWSHDDAVVAAVRMPLVGRWSALWLRRTRWSKYMPSSSSSLRELFASQDVVPLGLLPCVGTGYRRRWVLLSNCVSCGHWWEVQLIQDWSVDQNIDVIMVWLKCVRRADWSVKDGFWRCIACSMKHYLILSIAICKSQQAVAVVSQLCKFYGAFEKVSVYVIIRCGTMFWAYGDSL